MPSSSVTMAAKPFCRSSYGSHVALPSILAVVTCILNVLLRAAKRLAAPGAGPKVVVG
jgi:hypothetical protein